MSKNDKIWLNVCIKSVYIVSVHRYLTESAFDIYTHKLYLVALSMMVSQLLQFHPFLLILKYTLQSSSIFFFWFSNYSMKGLDSFGYIIQAHLDVYPEQTLSISQVLKTWILLAVENQRMRLLRSSTGSLRPLCLS